MEKEKKKPQTGIFFPCTEAQKRKIKSISAKCGLGQGEYILKRALGYEPKTVPPDAFFVFHEKLCEILDAPLTPDVEKAALCIFDEIYAQLIDNRKQTTEEIIADVKGSDAPWQQSDSGP
ncbi:MAG: hypothetical protein IJS45_00930 [Clostridia bacterium]|nr:hypothetical protein [Clostridia bacterium]